MLKRITSRSNGKGYSWLKSRLTSYMRGWLYYYRLGDMKNFILRTDKWYHRRLRMYIWKSWKRPKTRCLNLQNVAYHYLYLGNGLIVVRAIGDCLIVGYYIGHCQQRL